MLATITVDERRELLGGVRTRVLGVEGTGPPLVLLHGFSDSADTWRPLLARLARVRRRAIALDLPGFGAADPVRPGLVLPQFETVVAAAMQCVAQQSGQRPVLVGNSLGGAVSLYVANHRSSELAGIVPVCTAGLSHPRWVHTIAAPGVRSILPLLALPPLRGALGLPISRFAATARNEDVSAHAPVHLGHLSRSRLRHQLAIVRRLLDEERYPLDTRAITCPVMFVFGAADRAAGSSCHRGRIHRLAHAVPTARVEVIQGCGHVPQLEMPDTLLGLLDDFSPVRGRRRTTPPSAGQMTDLRPPSTGRGRPPSA
ncbi:MAG: alpha/beta fold hydrolase [Solirubrobacteraceae bacterium]